MEIIQKEEQPSNKSLLLIYFWLLIIGLIVIIVFILIEILLFNILHLIIVYAILAIPSDVACHLLLIRYLVVQLSFAGQFTIIQKQTIYSLGINQAKFVLRNVTSLENDLIRFEKKSLRDLSDYKELKKSMNKALNVIRYYIGMLQEMFTKYGTLTQIQGKFLRELHALNDTIIDVKLIEFISNDIRNIKGHKEQTISYLSISNSHINTNGNDESLCFENVINNSLLPHIREIQAMINNYTNEGRKWYSIKRIQTLFFTEFLGSLKQQRIELSYDFEFEEYSFPTDDKKAIDYIIIKGQKVEGKKNNLMIICGPNGASFELFSKNIKLNNLYLDKNCDVLCWNYRGYGFSTGRPTFKNIKEDIETLYTIVSSFNRWNKIGVHGISIGGIPCCSLARNKNIALLVSDRNFGAIDLIANTLPLGNWLAFLYKLLLLPDSYTLDDYLNANCYKIVLNDPNDLIVRESSSLKTTTSRYIIQKHLNAIDEVSTSIILSNRTVQLSKSPFSIFNSYLNHKDLFDLILTRQQKSTLIGILIELSNVMNSTSFEATNEQSKWCKCIKSNQYKNLKEEELQNTSGLFDFVKFKLGEFFNSLNSAGDTLSTLSAISNDRLKRLFICNFFSNLIIWGNKGEQTNRFSIEEAIKSLKDSIEILNQTLSTQEAQNSKGHFIILSIQELLSYLKIIEKAIDQLAINRSNSIQRQILNNSSIHLNTLQNLSLNDQLIQIGRGNLIHLSCGHNGSLSPEEFNLFLEQLHLSGFFE